MRKFLIVTLIIALLGTGGYFIWARFFRTDEFVQEEDKFLDVFDTKENISYSLPGLLVDEIVSYWFDEVGSIYVLRRDGSIALLDKTKTIQKVFDTNIDSFYKVQPSRGGRFALIAFGYPANLTFVLFDTQEQNWHALPRDIIAAAWNPNNDNILAYFNGEAILLFDIETGESELVTKFNAQDITLEWNHEEELLIGDQSSRYVRSSLWAFNFVDGLMYPIIRKEAGLMVAWSRGGNYGVKLTNSAIPNTSKLELINRKGVIVTDLPFITIPIKCMFEKTNLYCAVPYDNSLDNKIPDSYLQRAIYTKDEIVLIDFTDSNNPTQTNIYQSLSAFDAINLKKVGNTFYFMNRYDRGLYSIELNK